MSRASARTFFRTAAVVAGLALTSVAPSQTRAENLADALIGAYNTSGLLEQNRALLRAADEDVGLAVALLRPVLDFVSRATYGYQSLGPSGTALTNRTSRLFVGLSASYTLFDGGARRLGVQAQQETVLATRQTLLSIEQNILFRAVNAYMDVLLQTENVSLRENNVRVLGEELRAAQDRFDVGEVTRTDVALAESRLAGARSSLATARGLLVNAKAEYTNAVGRAPGTLAGQPPLPARPASVQAAKDIAVRNHPDVLAAQHQVAAADLVIQQTAKALGPNVSATADVGILENWRTSNDGNDSSIGLVLRQQIYQGGRLSAQVRRAMAVRDSARANLLTVQRDVIQEVNNAFVRLEVAKASLDATRERVRAAQVAFDGIREEATLGARTTLDVLTAENDLLDALTAQISATTEQSIAAYELLAAQGVLTAERLNLAVQIYDPTIYYNLTKNAPARTSQQSRDLDRVLEALGKR